MSDELVELLARRPTATGDDPDRLRTLLELLDRPDRAMPAVWVGGGHGKSSVVAMVSALLAALDVSAGTATAPHLQDIRERLRIAGRAIAGDTLRESLTYLAPFLGEVDDRYPAPLTFDEVLHALAATWFADAPVDVAVFEGRPGPTSRDEVVVHLGAPATTVTGGDGSTRVLGTDFAFADRKVAVGGQHVALQGVTAAVKDVYLPLHGVHQARNAVTALATVEAFLGSVADVDDDLLRQAYASVRLPGRLEVVRRTDGASVVLDGARDATAAKALAAALRTEFTVRHRIGVLGLTGGDPEEFVSALRDILDHVVVTAAPAPDAPAPERVVDAVRAAGVAVEIADSVPVALDSASGVATAEDLVVVTGGLPTAGAARTALGLAPADDLLHTT